MDPIEKAIRSAFEKGNADERDFREKVYRSAFAALDRALKANPNLTVEAAINRRKALQAKIAEIESEFTFAAAVVDPAENDAFEPSLDDVRPGNGGRASAAPDIAGEERTARRKPARAEGRAVAGERDERRARRFRIPFARLFVTATLVAALGIGGWWALQTGMFKSSAQRDTSVHNPAQTTTSEDFIPENEAAPIRPGQADSSRAWIDVFSPVDATSVSAPGATSAEVMRDSSGSFLRIRSGGSDEAVLFDVGQGVLEKLAGKQATFDIIARAADGKETQMSVDCNFGELGGCGRKRYVVGADRADYLFELDFRSKNPGSGGTIAINSDVGGGGKPVDIYEIRVSVSQ